LDNFVSSGDPDAYTTIIRTLVFFAQKYREDTAFAQRIDQSVLRILSLKYRIYGNTFSLQDTLPNQDALNSLGLSSQVTFDVARQAATLISPPLDELSDALPSPPGRNDHIVFINDTRVFQQCSTCRQQYSFDLDALNNAVIRLYGSSGQVLPGNLTSYSYQDLSDMLNAGTGVMQIENDLRQAEWIVFTMDNITADIPSSLALRQFLDLRLDLIQDKHLIVFALGAPYSLDATDISKLTAYYALYSRSSSFLEIAARLLFHEIQPMGHLPVSVPGISYEILTATSPDPNQVIRIFLDIPTSPLGEGTQTSEPTSTPTPWRVGDTIPLVSGVILDHNGNQVPDNTIVRFMLFHNGDSVPSQISEAQTSQGIARTTLRIDQSGVINIRAESGQASTSDILTYDIPPELITPTAPAPTTVATASPTPTSSPTETPTLTPSPTPIPTQAPTQGNVDFGDWLAALIVVSIIGGINYWFAYLKGGLRWGVRAVFLAMIGGMVTYSYLAIDMPGSGTLIQKSGVWGVIAITLIGAAIGAGTVWIWQALALRKIKAV
jgi:beta-N-acetylhexosaminidase